MATQQVSKHMRSETQIHTLLAKCFTYEIWHEMRLNKMKSHTLKHGVGVRWGGGVGCQVAGVWEVLGEGGAGVGVG